jgi:ubiquinone biosynthesis protein UbiJ
MPALQLASAVVENAINGVLKTQAHTHSSMVQLRGKRLTVFLDVLPQGFTLVFDDKVMVVNGPDTFEAAADVVDAHTCIIKTKVSVLPELSKTSHLTALIQKGDLNLVGDLSIAQKVSELLSSTNIDLEEALAHYTSDVFAHSAFSFFGKVHKKALSVVTSLSLQGGELITEERPIAARRQAVTGFTLQVSKLRDDVERLQAKLNAYERSLKAEKES